MGKRESGENGKIPLKPKFFCKHSVNPYAVTYALSGSEQASVTRRACSLYKIKVFVNDLNIYRMNFIKMPNSRVNYCEQASVARRAIPLPEKGYFRRVNRMFTFFYSLIS